ncbi:1-hydroxycarotenoid 3,4-desaturase CrtD [Tropicimonas sp. IMCC34043]|uniref:1-hydroxycarotenoid 3,4-desaturase CrtD n=1 Tax=Tropicimonas sp. IMCC34043 TaxID=2248760 RepID=UPI000E22B184|nr:1-hydroxycarotenoid 3,4-desaturase CrtD [Tropicimonas sp. IMCC34043]
MATREGQKVIVIGAGIGGLAAALSLRASGAEVTVFERHGHPGGKIRTRASAAGPVDTGPTVLTLRRNFESLFSEIGARLEDHIDLVAEPLLARHFWPDGSQLDLFADRAASADAVGVFAGTKASQEFRLFCDRASLLLDTFEAPVMRARRMVPRDIAARTLAGGLPVLRAMAPMRSMDAALRSAFSDSRLAQLFGRYATYVGGAPQLSPAILLLIWAAEEGGVWRIRGGMASLAGALHRLAVANGIDVQLGTPIKRLECQQGRVSGVVTDDGIRHAATAVVFNGDPAALQRGLLGIAATGAVSRRAVSPRSHSACVWAFAATPLGAPLVHHNVFFGTDPATEFGPLARGALPQDPALYVCAQDRGAGAAPNGQERFEIIMNAPPVSDTGTGWDEEETLRCHDSTIRLLSERGLHFTPAPEPRAMTTPADFARLFPGSDGSLYGRSPHGMMASFLRPTARSNLPGLYLAGGGVHPGPGIPMALLSGRHAAAAIVSDRTSTS